MKAGNVWIFAVIALAFAGLAAAQGMVGRQAFQGSLLSGIGTMQHHDKMYKIMEEGAYADLVSLRERYGFRIMPWVENEEDFLLAQQMHERMENYRERNNPGRVGCPMMESFR